MFQKIINVALLLFLIANLVYLYKVHTKMEKIRVVTDGIKESVASIKSITNQVSSVYIVDSAETLADQLGTGLTEDAPANTVGSDILAAIAKVQDSEHAFLRKGKECSGRSIALYMKSKYSVLVNSKQPSTPDAFNNALFLLTHSTTAMARAVSNHIPVPKDVDLKNYVPYMVVIDGQEQKVYDWLKK